LRAKSARKKSTFSAQSFFILPMLKPPATAADHKKRYRKVFPHYLPEF
jgi:hypothetical protein